MTKVELIEDLNNRCAFKTDMSYPNLLYFEKKLLERDDKRYLRRTFGDLFLHYRKKGVSERMLFDALITAGFCANICGDIKKIVWFKFRRKYLFFCTEMYNVSIKQHIVKNTKYTVNYMNALAEQSGHFN